MAVRWDAVLTADEAREAYILGWQRAKRGLVHKRRHNYDYAPGTAERFRVDAMAVVAEVLAARYLGATWLSSGDEPDSGAPDLLLPDGLEAEVRWTHYPFGCLILHPEDADHRVGVLATGSGRDLALIGWQHALAGKVPVYWRASGIRHPCYMIPQSKLTKF